MGVLLCRLEVIRQPFFLFRSSLSAILPRVILLHVIVSYRLLASDSLPLRRIILRSKLVTNTGKHRFTLRKMRMRMFLVADGAQRGAHGAQRVAT